MSWPLSLDNFWDWDDHQQDHACRSFDGQYGRLVREVFNKSRYTCWVRSELRPHLQTLPTNKWSPDELGNQLSISRENVWRNLNDEQNPPPERIDGWLRLSRSTYPPIVYDPIYEAVAASAAVERVRRDKHAASKATRAGKLRSEIQEREISDAALIYAMSTLDDVRPIWLSLAHAFQADLAAAVESERFRAFLADLLCHTSRLFGSSADKPYFVDSARAMAAWDVTSTKDVQALLGRIASLWNSRGLFTLLVSRCIDEV